MGRDRLSITTLYLLAFELPKLRVLPLTCLKCWSFVVLLAYVTGIVIGAKPNISFSVSPSQLQCNIAGGRPLYCLIAGY